MFEKPESLKAPLYFLENASKKVGGFTSNVLKIFLNITVSCYFPFVRTNRKHKHALLNQPLSWPARNGDVALMIIHRIHNGARTTKSRLDRLLLLSFAALHLSKAATGVSFSVRTTAVD